MHADRHTTEPLPSLFYTRKPFSTPLEGRFCSEKSSQRVWGVGGGMGGGGWVPRREIIQLHISQFPRPSTYKHIPILACRSNKQHWCLHLGSPLSFCFIITVFSLNIWPNIIHSHLAYFSVMQVNNYFCTKFFIYEQTIFGQICAKVVISQNFKEKLGDGLNMSHAII